MKNVKLGYYYVTPNWEFKYSPTITLPKKALKMWKVENYEQFHNALDEATNLRCVLEKVKVGKIQVKLGHCPPRG